MKTSDYKQLHVWQKSILLVKDIYILLKSFPKEELYCICDQMRRCAISIPSNIAEGQARNSNKEFIRFLSYSKGSIAELETQLIISFQLGYINKTDLERLNSQTSEISKMLHALICAINTSDTHSTTKNEKL